VPDIFTILTKDHSDVKAMLTELEAGTGQTDLAQRRAELAEQLVIAESKHEAAEEQYFWPTVRDKLPNGDTLADEAIGQETEGKRILDELRKLSSDNIEFDSLVNQFISAGREHIAFEEEKVWPGLRAVLPADEAEALGERFERAENMGPTRPHPKTPPSPGVLKTAGVAAAVADKAADAMTGRGKSDG
jgi:hemerythrin superfamily protein